ncbi:MAG: ATP synthase F1 subunit delta [Bacillota bacterium]
MPDPRITSSYSRALLASARCEGRIGPVRRELAELEKVLVEVPEFRSLWNARLPANRKATALDAVLRPRLSPLTLRFLKVLITHRRERYLPLIARYFAALCREAEKRAEVRVASAFPLPDDLRREIIETAARLTGFEPEVEFSVDAGLLGGLIIRFGDFLIDASVKGRLNSLGRLFAEDTSCIR